MTCCFRKKTCCNRSRENVLHHLKTFLLGPRSKVSDLFHILQNAIFTVRSSTPSDLRCWWKSFENWSCTIWSRLEYLGTSNIDSNLPTFWQPRVFTLCCTTRSKIRSCGNTLTSEALKICSTFACGGSPSKCSRVRLEKRSWEMSVTPSPIFLTICTGIPTLRSSTGATVISCGLLSQLPSLVPTWVAVLFPLVALPLCGWSSFLPLLALPQWVVSISLEGGREAANGRKGGRRRRTGEGGPPTREGEEEEEDGKIASISCGFFSRSPCMGPSFHPHSWALLFRGYLSWVFLSFQSSLLGDPSQ